VAEGGALRSLLALFDIRVNSEELEEAGKKVDGFVDKLKLAARTIGEALAIREVSEFFAHGIEQAAHLQDLSDRLNVSASAIQGFGYAAKSAGVDLDSAAHALSKLQQNVGQAILGGTQKGAFKRLGVDVQDATGKARPLNEIVLDLAESFKKLPDQTTRAAYAAQLFGRQGRLLLPVLMKGREGIEEFFGEANQLGDKFPAQAKEAREAWEKFTISIDVFKQQVLATTLEAIGPPLLKIVEALGDGVRAVIEFNKHSHVLIYVLEAVAVATGVRLVSTVRALASTFSLGMDRMIGKLREVQVEEGKATAGLEAMKAESAGIGAGPGGSPSKVAGGGATKGPRLVGGALLTIGLTTAFNDLFADDGPISKRIDKLVHHINPASYLGDVGGYLGDKIGGAVSQNSKSNYDDVDTKIGENVESFVGYLNDAGDAVHKLFTKKIEQFVQGSNSSIPDYPGGFAKGDPKGFASMIALESLKYSDKKLYDIRKGLTQADPEKQSYATYHQIGPLKQDAKVEQNIRFGDINIDASSGEADDIGSAAKEGVKRGAKSLENANTLNARVVS
jgi:Phage-related minor tail protein